MTIADKQLTLPKKLTIMKLKIHFNHREELWNAWSHAGGIIMGIVVGIIFLIWCFREHNGWATAGIILYLFGMLCSYIASTVYHSLSAWSKWKERLRKWDHAAIYWHIAGSYSPITLIALRDQGYWGLTLFCFIWACAIAGTVISFVNLKDHSNLETIAFVGMGLSVLVAFKPLIDALTTSAFIWIIAEGVCCSVLQHQQAEIYAYCFPLLCTCRQYLSYHCSVGYIDEIYLKRLSFFSVLAYISP